MKVASTKYSVAAVLRNKRVNLKRILADPVLRRKLMVSTIQAIQAREGIETTEEQAQRAYDTVTKAKRLPGQRLGVCRRKNPLYRSMAP